MDLTVLVKVTPDRDTLRFDPERRTVARSGAPSFLNPFDQRALRVALDLRRPGEKVHLVSMGPPQIAPLLTETYAVGVDHVVLISDEALAGSDALVTARVLARAVQRLGRTLVLTGDRSTDGESGVIPGALAPLLWAAPIVRARSILRSDTGFEFDVTADTEDGWARYRVSAPCLIAVGEKIAKPKKATPAEAATVAGRPIERWTISDLGFRAREVGRAGSQTTLVDVSSDAAVRTPRTYSGSTLLEGIGRAREWLAPVSGPLPSEGEPFPPLAGEEAYDRELLVLASGPDGKVEPIALEILSEMRRRLPDHGLAALWVGPYPTVRDRERLARAGAVRGYGLHGPSDPILPEVATLGVERAMDQRPHAAAVILPSTLAGREIAGRLSARRSLGIVTDAEEVHSGPAGQLLWTKPSFGGSYLATVVTSSRPSIVTFRPRRTEHTGAVPNSSLDWIGIAFEPPRSPIQRIDSGVERGAGFGRFDVARTVVGVGMGIGGPEAIRGLLPDLAGRGIALAASRRVVDAGWVPPHLQVGLTGRSIAPPLGILVGVSGSTNFMVGWRRARHLIAINRDASASVFRGVDLGLVGPWEEILPSLLEAIPRSPTASPS
jgi:electron transfer flavoprotein alpha subunit